jgi:hypothetical protein
MWRFFIYPFIFAALLLPDTAASAGRRRSSLRVRPSKLRHLAPRGWKLVNVKWGRQSFPDHVRLLPPEEVREALAPLGCVQGVRVQSLDLCVQFRGDRDGPRSVLLTAFGHTGKGGGGESREVFCEEISVDETVLPPTTAAELVTHVFSDILPHSKHSKKLGWDPDS